MNDRSIRIKEVQSRKDRKRFITFPWLIYAGDPNWVPPLIREEKKKLSPRSNPFWDHAEAAFYLAFRGEEPVGRIAAIEDRLFIDYHREKTGYFGFFECRDDTEAARLLLKTAETWLKERGLNKMIGPLNPSTNDICGLLIEGYDTPPKIMMPYNPPYYPKLLEDRGLTKAKDLLAYRIPVPEEMNPRLEKISIVL
ncbi:MAG: hypothetical protein U9N73_02695, partial [Candidatus Auribacterota bacterium]|nr:hypothetical protein [Candidatus Auribacterota bacterium]